MRVSAIEIYLEKDKGMSWANWKEEVVVPEWVIISRGTLCNKGRETGDD